MRLLLSVLQRSACIDNTVRLTNQGVIFLGSSTHLRRKRTLSTTARDIRIRRKDAHPVADTIYALSSAPGRAAIAVIRVTGPACLDVYGGLCPKAPFPIPRVATLRRLFEPVATLGQNAQVLENSALVLYFPSPKTVTGEDVLELHVHGGPAIVKSILDAIPNTTSSRTRKRPGEYSLIRPAEAGEFTKRAFYNGRLDLTQAEALSDLLTAETEQQRRLAIGGDGSSLAERYEQWRTMLLYARGEMEALIDFSEDQHFDESPTQLVASISRQIEMLKGQIDMHLQNASKGELMRNGISVALLGAPNTGKSSLLNRIVGREAAIVSAEEGTTRDVIDVSVDIGGWLIRLGDLAGLRAKGETIGLVETEGIRRAKTRALDSDVVIALFSLETNVKTETELRLSHEVIDAVIECMDRGKDVVFVINKIDLLSKMSASAALQQLRGQFPLVPSHKFVCISCKEVVDTAMDRSNQDPGNIQLLLKTLTSTFEEMTVASDLEVDTALSGQQKQDYWTATLSITNRQSASLRQCKDHLDEFLSKASGATDSVSSEQYPQSRHYIDNHDDLVGSEHEVDIVALAEDLRFAAACLARITGRGEGTGDVEDVLGVVFEK